MSVDPIMIEPIVPPPDWTAERDLEFFLERWAPQRDPVAFVLGTISESYRELSELLTSATSFYLRTTNVSWRTAECMSFNDKAAWLETFVLTHDVCASYRERICSDLKVCRWVDVERWRIVGNYLAENGSGWLYPLIRFSDRLTTALIDLEQTLKAEADGFTRFQTRRILQESSAPFSAGVAGPEQNAFTGLHRGITKFRDN